MRRGGGLDCSVFKPPAAKHALMPCVPRVHPSSMHRYACGCSSRPLWHSSQQIRPPGEYLYIEFVLKVSSRLFSSSPIFAHIRTPILQASRTQGHQGPILPLHRIPRGQGPDRLIVYFFCQGLGIGTCVCVQVCVSVCQWLARILNLTIQKGG